MSTPGIDWTRLVGWMAANVPDAGEPTGISLIAGGRSNLTYVLETRERRLVLRRPPLGHVLPTAHDMRREWRVISALAPTPVPVPEPVAFCGDEDVIGAPFYLMGHVEGAAVRNREDVEGARPRADPPAVERLAEVLAAIHAIDYEEVGLGDFGRPEGYMARPERATMRYPGCDQTVRARGSSDARRSDREALRGEEEFFMTLTAAAYPIRRRTTAAALGVLSCNFNMMKRAGTSSRR